MPNKTTTRKHTPRRKNPTGRVDVLAVRLIDAAVKRYAPQLAQLHAELRPRLELELARRIGPRTKRGRTIRNFIKLAQAPRPTIGVKGHTFADEGGQV